ncbi:MAG: hypothetical protein FJW96_08745 [Actinobacteria bacterium]|nr:hypothetical protein [Actinomycetota bacterium]
MGRVVKAIAVAASAVAPSAVALSAGAALSGGAALSTGAALAAPNPIVDAARRTAKMRTMSLSLQSVTVVAGAGEVKIGGTVEQVGTASARLALVVRANGERIALDGVMLREQGRYVMYARSPAFAANLPPGKEWMRFDLDAAARNQGIDFSGLVASQGTLGPLEHGIEKTTKLETGEVAGVRATRYRVVLDVARAAAKVPAFGKQITALEGATGIRLRQLKYDVWIDGDGLLRRVRFAIPLASEAARGSSTTTMTFTDFNQPVEVTAPPADLVASPPPA